MRSGAHGSPDPDGANRALQGVHALQGFRPMIFSGKPYAEGRTVIPLRMSLYLQALAFAQGMTPRALHVDGAARFLDDRPWERGLAWRNGRRPETGDPEWAAVTVRLPRDLADRLDLVAHRESVHPADLLYTMLFWYAWALYPPLHEQERRRRLLQGE